MSWTDNRRQALDRQQLKVAKKLSLQFQSPTDPTDAETSFSINRYRRALSQGNKISPDMALDH